MKIKTILVDDEINNLEALKALLGYLPELEICGAYTEAKMAISEIELQKPALLFLDIRMPELDGFDLLERLNFTPKAIIFITAASDQAIKAFKVEAVDFLLKPVLFSDLKAAVARAVKKIQSARQSQADILSFSTQDGIEMVRIEDIIRLEGAGAYTKIFVENARPVLVSKNLGEIESSLENRGFMRVHTSHIINPNKIIRYKKEEGGYLLMADQTEIPISRRRKDEILEWMKGLG